MTVNICFYRFSSASSFRVLFQRQKCCKASQNRCELWNLCERQAKNFFSSEVAWVMETMALRMMSLTLHTKLHTVWMGKSKHWDDCHHVFERKQKAWRRKLVATQFLGVCLQCATGMAKRRLKRTYNTHCITSIVHHCLASVDA